MSFSIIRKSCPVKNSVGEHNLNSLTVARVTIDSWIKVHKVLKEISK